MTSYLQVENISKSWGINTLFTDISFIINQNQKTALIARNGAGKTTLLRIIAGLDLPDSGNVSFNKNLIIGYLEQDPILDLNKTVLENIVLSDNKFCQCIIDYEKALETSNKKLMEKAIDEMEFHHAWDYEVKIKMILGELKIYNLSQQVKEMSGGQMKCVALAREILKEPEMLILDEPTNHLDLDMIEWLEDYLSRASLTLFMVTHDRYFLDNVCNNILELDTKMYSYKGNYSYFLEKRQQRIEIETAEIEKAQNSLRKEQDWMRRMPKARTHKAKYRIENFYNLKEKAQQKTLQQDLNLSFIASRLGTKILELKGISKAYGELELIKNFSYRFTRFEKIGIIGKNGCGKSTFLNIITEKIKADIGIIDKGETVVFGYFNQSGIQFDENKTVIEVIKEIAENINLDNDNQMSAAQFLNHFMFPFEIHYMQVAKLSGGEKRRLYLLTILIKNPNFLIFDEPTNDLDIMTLNVLENYLQNFSGGLIVVTHDRFFMDNIVDSIFAFEGNGVIKNYPGNYTQYRMEKASEEQKVKKKKEPSAKLKREKVRKLSFKEKQEFEILEKEIQKLTKEKTEIEALLSSGRLNSDVILEKSQRFNEVINLIDEKELRWLELSEI